MKILVLTFLSLISLINAQVIVLPDQDGFADRFVVKIHRTNPPQNTFLASGVLLNQRHVLTIASAVQGLTVNILRIHFGNTRLTGSADVGVELISIIPSFNVSQPLENNLAVLRIPQSDANRITNAFLPRQLGELQMNHFCTMFGFGTRSTPQWVGNEQMNMEAARIRDSVECDHLFHGNFFCTAGTPGRFANCGGFIGAPIICDGERLAGLVTQEQYCGPNPRAYIINIQHHHEWITRTSSVGKIMTSIMMIIFGVFISKLM
ncbi:hypothetical protein PVAND_015310 [Polypedilum vanderplanki]|uniref:Peptidase S1 domain-containing protein n=1 Tax=Polypedilum vanderplanki TaxID=319348 RepID=A0A9J6BCN2_POLVA|nr:hypothetical protein PVAND_015310 [Polypedilum vanderplanki]